MTACRGRGWRRPVLDMGEPRPSMSWPGLGVRRETTRRTSISSAARSLHLHEPAGLRRWCGPRSRSIRAPSRKRVPDFYPSPRVEGNSQAATSLNFSSLYRRVGGHAGASDGAIRCGRPVNEIDHAARCRTATGRPAQVRSAGHTKCWAAPTAPAHRSGGLFSRAPWTPGIALAAH